MSHAGPRSSTRATARRSGGPSRRDALRAVALAAGASVVGSSGTASAVQDGGTGIPSELPSAIVIDREALTVRLPLYRGVDDEGETVSFVLTDVSGFDEALGRGVNWSPKLRNVLDTPAVQPATGELQSLRGRTQSPVRFRATVDFAPERTVAPGPEGFPLDEDATRAGAVGDPGYSPFFTTDGETVYNAPHVANASGRHDAVVALDRDEDEVVLRLTPGFYEGVEALYVGTDAAPEPVAALEGGTYAPALAETPAPGDRDLGTSAREPVFAVVNGPTGAAAPDRQGLRSAVAGEGPPLDVLRSDQVCADPADPTTCSVFYSPLREVYPVAWTEAAVAAGRRTRLASHQQLVGRYLRGDLASAAPDGPPNTLLANVPASGALANRPLVRVGRGPA